MKNNFSHLHDSAFYIVILTLIFCIITDLAKAQKPNTCGGYRIDKGALQEALQFEKNNPRRTQATPYLLRVYFHICRFDDGSNPGATKAQIDAEFQTLKADYAIDNVCFLYAGLNFINDTKLDTVNVNEADFLVDFLPYMVPGCINIFYTSEINGVNQSDGGGIGGYGIFGNICLVAKQNINAGHTISHEVGHFLGLLHTFDRSFGLENIDGSNCAIAADLICDTHADPFAFIGENCFKTSGCNYTGDCKDPNGQSNFSPPFRNMMAYWWGVGNCSNNLTFTQGQLDRINTFLAINPSIISCESPGDEVVGFFANVSDGYYFKSAIHSLTTTGPVDFHGTAEVTLGAQNVSLEPGFHSYPSSGGIVTIKATGCNYSTLKNAIISKSPERKQEEDKEKKLIIYPNPSASFVVLQFDVMNNETNGIVELYNMSGEKVKEVRLGKLSVGKQRVQMLLSSLKSGIYSLKLRLNKDWMYAKVVLIK